MTHKVAPRARYFLICFTGIFLSSQERRFGQVLFSVNGCFDYNKAIRKVEKKFSLFGVAITSLSELEEQDALVTECEQLH